MQRILRALVTALLASWELWPARAQAAPDKDPEEVQAKKDEERPHTEFNPVPLVGGDTDIGWGGGAVIEIARHDAGYHPYKWSLEMSGLLTFKDVGGSFQTPYQDYYALLKLPHLLRDMLDLQIRPSFSNEAALKYYGLGNASLVTPYSSLVDPYYEFGRIHPTLLVSGRLNLPGPYYALVANSFRYNILDVHPDTKLAAEQSGGSREVRALLGSFASHAADIFEYAVGYDTRDSEIEPQWGMWHQISMRLSPGGGSLSTVMPYRYGQGDVTLRGYVTPVKKYLTLAARVVADWQFGDVPFYELAGYEETYAIGGVQGVRGVPAQRYYGKEKVFANVEARSTLVSFHMLGRPFAVGIAAFFDGGRVWADGFNHPELDGTTFGLKYGAGGGVRLHQGDSMVIRFDVAWSPDAQPISAYFAAGEIF